MKEPFPIEICQCCMLILANGECCEEEEEECDSAQFMAKTTRGQRDVTLGGPDDELGFSWSHCELCSSRLHGDRYRAYEWS